MANGEFLFRIVEGAPVALYRAHVGSGPARSIPARQDLFRYSGGYGWGYKGTGAKALSFAIVSTLYEDDGLPADEFRRRADVVLEDFLPQFDGQEEHDIKAERIDALFE